MSLLESVRDLVVVNSNHHALKLSIAMRDGPVGDLQKAYAGNCLLYTSPSPRDLSTSRMPSSA